MSTRCRNRWAALLGVCLAPAGLGLAQGPVEPAPLGLAPGDGLPCRTSNNQKMADVIADQLRQSGQLRQYAVDISYNDKTVVLSGQVSDQMQKDEVLRIVQGVPGVDRVIDRLGVQAGIARVQAELPAPRPVPSMPTLPPPTPEPGGARGPELNPNGPAPEPSPIFSAPPPSATDVTPPRMPPYAWPTYAPYNNYSRVGYPTSYPYNAWPYIGPFYPFPKVPLGWRKVTLEWDDGHWWFSTHATKYDWWRLRYW